MQTIKEIKQLSKQFLDANIHDGDDRSGCRSDFAVFTPDELQELFNDFIDILDTEEN